MFVCHIALQGCLTLSDVPYGINADTGGHITYLLELAERGGLATVSVLRAKTTTLEQWEHRRRRELLRPQTQ